MAPVRSDEVVYLALETGRSGEQSEDVSEECD